jgi:hypothetical protein
MIGLLAKPWDMTVASTSGAAFNSLYPATNAVNNDYGRVVRTVGLAAGNTSTIVFDLGTARAVDCLALLWHNMVPGDSINWQASDTAAFTAVQYQSGNLGPITGQTARDSMLLAKQLLTLANPVTQRYWRVVLTTSGAKASGIQFSRAFVGKSQQFIVGPQKASLGAKDLNSSVTTETGETRSQEDSGLIRPVVSLSFSYNRMSEMEQLIGQYTLTLGVSKPALICTDLTTAFIQDNIAFGRLEKVVTMESDVYDVWSFEAVVTSLGI